MSQRLYICREMIRIIRNGGVAVGGHESAEKLASILRASLANPDHAGSVYLRPDSEREARDALRALDEINQGAAPTSDGPALQWAHASADTRAPVLALLDSEAADSRHNAAVAREEGKTAEALAEEGRAMAHEAAAAVLRASR